MKLLQKPARGTASNGSRKGGVNGLFHRGLLARWFVLYRLVEEVDRAGRYARPISVVVARPALLRGERVQPDVLKRVADSASRTARSTDLVGWLTDDSILIVMPETQPHEAAVAAHRLRNEVWLHSRTAGGQKWDVIVLDRLESFATLDDFQTALDAAPPSDGQVA